MRDVNNIQLLTTTTGFSTTYNHRCSNNNETAAISFKGSCYPYPERGVKLIDPLCPSHSFPFEYVAKLNPKTRSRKSPPQRKTCRQTKSTSDIGRWLFRIISSCAIYFQRETHWGNKGYFSLLYQSFTPKHSEPDIRHESCCLISDMGKVWLSFLEIFFATFRPIWLWRKVMHNGVEI